MIVYIYMLMVLCIIFEDLLISKNRVVKNKKISVLLFVGPCIAKIF